MILATFPIYSVLCYLITPFHSNRGRLQSLTRLMGTVVIMKFPVTNKVNEDCGDYEIENGTQSMHPPTHSNRLGKVIAA